MSDILGGGTPDHEPPDDALLFELDARIDATRPVDAGARDGSGSPDVSDDRAAGGVPAAPAAPAAGGVPSGLAPPELAAVVDGLRALDDQTWEAAVPLASLAAAGTGHVGGDAAPVAGHRRRHRRRLHRPATADGRPSRTRTLVAVAAAVVVLAAVSVAVAARVGNGPTPRNGSVPSAASWRVAGYLDQPTWSETSGTAGPTVAVTCPTVTACYADAPGGTAAAVIEASTDGGTSWRADPLPAGTRVTTKLACPTAEQCLVAANGGTSAGSGAPAGGSPSILATDDGGSSWTVRPLPGGIAEVVGLACSTASQCVGDGIAGPTADRAQGTPVAVVTNDGGSTWALVPLPGPLAPSGTDGISCTPSLSCVLVGTSGYATSADGAAAGRAVVLESGDGGQQWATASIPAGTAVARSVSCAGTGQCVAIADPPARPAPGTSANDPYGPALALASSDGGKTWSAPGSVGLVASTLVTITCPVPSDCWAAGSLLTLPSSGPSTAVVVSTSNGGASWSTGRLPTEPTPAQRKATGLVELDIQTVTSVSCPSVGACVAFGFQGSLANPADEQIVLTEKES